MWSRSIAIAVVLAACGPDEASDEGPAAPEEVPLPRWVEPANLSKVIYADRDEPFVFEIADARSDLVVEIDKQVFVPTPGGVIERVGDTLVFRVEGSMVALLHDVVLLQYARTSPRRSESLTLGIVDSELEPVSTSVDQLLGAAEHLGGRGSAGDAVLGSLVGDVLTVHRSESVGDAWAWAASNSSVELPGLASDPHSWSVTIVEGEPWFAWRVESPTGQTEIRMLAGPSAAVETLWTSDGPEAVDLLGSHEHGSAIAVAWIGRTAILSVEAVRDVERATPGDRALLLQRIDPAGQVAGPIQVVRGPGIRDIDSLSPWLSLAPDAELAMAVRLGRAVPWSLQLGASGLPTFAEEPEPIELADDLIWLGGFDGAFGSRQALWISSDGLRLGVVRIDRLLDRSETSEVALASPPSGPLAFAVVGGVPTLVVPHGDEPMELVRSTGGELVVEGLADSCLEVALLVSLPGSRAGELPFACLATGSVGLGVFDASG